MELDEELEKTEDIFKTWENRRNKQIAENLKNAVRHKNGEEIEIGDIGAIDSIEDEIVRCEILNGEMLDIPIERFKEEIEEGDIVNLKLTYQKGSLIKTEILRKKRRRKGSKTINNKRKIK